MLNKKCGYIVRNGSRKRAKNTCVNDGLTSTEQGEDSWSAIDHNIPVAVKEVLMSYRELPNEAQQSSKAIRVISSSGNSFKKSTEQNTS
jgi:hypothetical protein